MLKFVKQTPFMKKLYVKNKFKKNTCIPKSCLLACTKFQAESRLITTLLFSCTNFVFTASSLKNQKSC